MTVREVLARVRLAVFDTDTANPRWTNTDLTGWLNDAIREFVRLRPDFKVQTDGSLGLVSAVTEITDTVGLPRDMLVPLADYVAEQVYSSDSADTANADRAKWHRDRWRQAVIGE